MRSLPTLTLSALLLSCLGSPSSAQESVDATVYWKIPQEATDRSKVMDTFAVLTHQFVGPANGLAQLPCSPRIVPPAQSRIAFRTFSPSPYAGTFGHSLLRRIPLIQRLHN